MSRAIRAENAQEEYVVNVRRRRKVAGVLQTSGVGAIIQVLMTKEEQRAKSAAYYKSHIEEARAYRIANREKISKREKEYRQAHKEEIAARKKRRYDSLSKEEKRELFRRNKKYQTRKYSVKFYLEHKDELYARSLDWLRRHPEKAQEYHSRRRALKHNAGGRFTASEFEKMKLQYGNKCARCAFEGKLEADHVMPLSKGGVNYISNIQPLCKRCNSKKNDKIEDWRLEFVC